MIVSPTYFGAVADVAALAEVAHARGVPLVVDEAWGAHLHFSVGAADRGARVRRRRRALLDPQDRRLASPSRRSSTSARGDRIDERIVDRAVTLIESTSPSALLTASLDAARRQAATHGEELLAETVDSLRRAPRADPRDPRARRARRADRRPRRRPRLRPAAAGGRRPRHRRDRPPDRAADARAGRHQPRALRRERGRRRVRDRRARGRDRRAAGRGARARLRAARRGRGGAAAAVRRAAALGPDRALAARGVPRPGRRWSPFDAGRGPDRGRVAGRLPARGPERAPRRAADRADARLHRRQRRPRRPGPRRQRPHAEDDQGGARSRTPEAERGRSR